MKNLAEILIVEDSLTQAEELKYILECNNYKVHHAIDGETAIEILKELNPDVIISDIVMPGMNGYEFCAISKSTPRLSNIPVILLTSLSNPGDIIRGLQSKADSFIVKPYDEEFLISRIRYFMQNTEFRKNSSEYQRIEINYADKNYMISTSARQILDILLSTYENSLLKNRELLESNKKFKMIQDEMKHMNLHLEQQVEARTMELVENNKNLLEEIVQRKKMEESLKINAAKLENSNKELEQFAYIASHDLQEPLRMVASFTQLLEKRYANQLNSEAKEFIGFAVDGATRMQKMINDLLRFSRITTQGQQFEKLDLSKLLADALSNLHQKIVETGTEVTSEDLPIVNGDESQLTRLFQNLIDNAIKFRGESSPKIHISFQSLDDFWEISVKDNGTGINPDYHERIFQIFQKLNNNQNEGTGIGLAVCKRIVERHGGEIWIESEEGNGSTFYFTILKK